MAGCGGQSQNQTADDVATAKAKTMATGTGTATAAVYGSLRVLCMGFLFPLYILPVLLYRKALVLVAKVFRPDLSHMLRTQGHLFVRDSVALEPNLNLAHVLQVEGEGTPDVQALRSLIAERFVYAMASDDNEDLSYPELQQYCVRWGGYFFWKWEPSFSMAEHVQIRELGPGQDFRDAELQFLRNPLTEKRSPWQILVTYKPANSMETETKTHSNTYYIIFKFHHSLADGISIVDAISRWTDADANPGAKANERSPPRHDRNQYSNPMVTRISHPFKLVTELLRLLTARTPLLPWPTIPTEPVARGSRKQHMCIGRDDDDDQNTQRFEIAALKRVAAQHAVSLNAVVHAGLSGALRRHMLDNFGHDGYADGNGEAEVPSHASVIQPVPLPAPLRHPPGLCNSLCFVTYTLPIGEPDPLLRLHATHAMLEARKSSVEAYVTYAMTQSVAVLPSSWPWPYKPAAGAAYVATTNLAGPRAQIRLNGQRVLRWRTEVVAMYMSFYISIISYNGWLEWTCNGDTRVFTEPELRNIAESIKHEFESLGRLAKPTEEQLVAMDARSRGYNVESV